MICDEVIIYLDLLVDDELPADTTAVVMKHIASCLQCAEEWDYKLILKGQFELLRESIVVPAHGLASVDKHLEATSYSPRVRQLIATAAAVIVAGIACFVWNYPHSNSRSASLEQILHTYESDATASSEPLDRRLTELSHHVKFKPTPFHMPGWSIASADVVHLPEHVCMLRLVYKTQINGQPRTIVSYQSCQGDLDARRLSQLTVDGRQIRCGQINGLTLVYWSDGARDHLFVSAIPENELMSLAVHS